MIRANLLSLPRRFAISTSMAFSVALVVCVLAGFLSMAAGFEKALSSAGSPAVAVVLGGGTNQETGSDVPADVIRSIAAMRGDIGLVRDTGGNLLLSREIVVPVELRGGKAETAKMLALRGMDAVGPSLRDGVTLTAGRLARAGAREIVVGERIAAEFPDDLAIGRLVRLGAVDWTVVGHFSSGGSAFESEIWADLDAARSAFDRVGEVQSVRVRLDEAGGIDKLRGRFAKYLGHTFECPNRGRPLCRTIFRNGKPHPHVRLAAGPADGARCDCGRAQYHDELGIRPDSRDRYGARARLQPVVGLPRDLGRGGGTGDDWRDYRSGGVMAGVQWMASEHHRRE